MSERDRAVTPAEPQQARVFVLRHEGSGTGSDINAALLVGDIRDGW